MDNLDLCTAEHFRLNDALVKMVLNGSITNADREELLHKAKLLKLEDGRWKDSEGSILNLKNPETLD
jgi:hypothetical protein